MFKQSLEQWKEFHTLEGKGKSSLTFSQEILRCVIRTPSSVCRIRKIWGRIFIWLFTFRWLKSILIQSDKFHSVSVSYIGCPGSGFRPASSLCERFRQQLVSTRAHVKTMKLCVLTNSSPILMHFHFQILQMWLFPPAIKWGLVFGARLKKRKTKYETWCTVCTNSAWFRCENERRAAHMSEEDDMRSSVEESSDLAPPPAVWRIAWYFCMRKTYALLMCWVAFALLQRWETVPCAGLLTLCSPYGHPSGVREKTPPPLSRRLVQKGRTVSDTQTQAKLINEIKLCFTIN